MGEKNSNEMNYDELAKKLIEQPEMADEILNTISDTNMLENLYDALFSQLGEYDKSYNIEHNAIILQIQIQISSRIEHLRPYNLLKTLRKEHSDLTTENESLSAELSKLENTNEIGE